MNIKPYRNYDEHEIINGLFTFNGLQANKGTFVTPQGSGYNTDDEMLLENLSPIGNTLSAKFNVPAKVVPAASGAGKAQIAGMLLYSHQTWDENGESLIFHPRKAAELEVSTSGQAAVLLHRGEVLYSGIDGNPAFGSGAAISDTTPGALKVVDYSVATVGKFLGPKNAEGYALLQIQL